MKHAKQQLFEFRSGLGIRTARRARRRELRLAKQKAENLGDGARRKGTRHVARPSVGGPVHVTLSLRRGLPSLRTPRAYRVLERAFRAGNSGFGFSLYQFSVQREHMHMIVDVNNTEALSRGMQGLAIRIAKALNKHWHGRKGSVFAERFFARVLKRPVQVWRAVRYVLNNARKHGAWTGNQPDPFSSGRWFKGWSSEVKRPLRRSPVISARDYLTDSWRHMGRIGVTEVPGTHCSVSCFFPPVSLLDARA